jgi:hypothetical protein
MKIYTEGRNTIFHIFYNNYNNFPMKLINIKLIIENYDRPI